MARTRQKKRVVGVQTKEMDLVVEDEIGENEQPLTPEPESEPTPPKKGRLSKKPETRITSKPVERITRSTIRKTASRSNISKKDSQPPKPSQSSPSPPVLLTPALVISEDLNTDESDTENIEIQPQIIIQRLPQSIVSVGKKSVSIKTPQQDVTPAEKYSNMPSPKTTRQSDERSIESPKDISTEQVRDYMSPNDALSSTTMYATLGSSLSPQINHSIGEIDDCDLSSQTTQRASSTYFKQIHDKSILNSRDQLIESVTTFGSTYYFIESSGANDENSEIMEKAYFCLVSRGFSVSWLAEADIINLPEDNDLYFVLPEFDGPLFEKIKDHSKWKAFLPIGLLHFHSQATPVRDYPIMDFSMRNCFVTVSGFPRELRKTLEEKIRLMAGQISASIKDRTTHVIASTWNTEKCLFARSHGFPLVMTPDWVEYCWENIHQEEAVDALELSYNRICRLPIFSGFIISSANLTERGQERLCNLVTENGGIFQNIIDPFRTTHLVILKREGPKYEKALEHENIKIVQLDWIHESIARGYPLPEQDITVKKMATKMLSKFMDLMGVVSSVHTDFTERSSTSMASGVRVPGSPELSEDEMDEENVANQENELR